MSGAVLVHVIASLETMMWYDAFPPILQTLDYSDGGWAMARSRSVHTYKAYPTPYPWGCTNRTNLTG